MKLNFPHIQKSFVFATLVVCTFSTRAADEYVIGLTGAFTGGSSSLGAPMREGIRFAAEQLNAAGGIGGKPITLVERDDEARPPRGVEIAKEFVNVTKVCAVIGFSNTGVGLAAHGIYQEAKTPVLVGPSSFRVEPNSQNRWS